MKKKNQINASDNLYILVIYLLWVFCDYTFKNIKVNTNWKTLISEKNCLVLY